MTEKKLSSFDLMMQQYEQAHQKSKSNSTFDEKNYFNTYLKDGLKEYTFRVRLLPSPNSITPFDEVEIHSTQVNDGNGGLKNRKIICARKHGDGSCPYCDKREDLYAEGSEETVAEAKTYGTRTFYNVRIIDRDNPEHGVKIWRFPKNFKKDGVYDKIMSLVKILKKDISQPLAKDGGRDIAVQVQLVPGNKGEYPAVTSITHLDPSDLSDNEGVMEDWLKDPKTWKYVYSVKTKEYLQILLDGGVPYFDKESELYVSRESINSKKEDQVKKAKEESPEPLKVETQAVNGLEDPDDLPF